MARNCKGQAPAVVAARNVFISSNPVIDCVAGASLWMVIIKGNLLLHACIAQARMSTVHDVTVDTRIIRNFSVIVGGILTIECII